MNAKATCYIELIDRENKEFLHKKNLLICNGGGYVPNFGQLQINFFNLDMTISSLGIQKFKKAKEILVQDVGRALLEILKTSSKYVKLADERRLSVNCPMDILKHYQSQNENGLTSRWIISINYL
jgi:hypothetical protein